MDWKKLILNVALVAFWSFIAALQASGELSEAALWAAGAAALRAAVGYLADRLGKPVPVDR